MKSSVLKREQFVTDSRGKRVGVLLDLRTDERFLEAAEELADIRAYDKARPTIHKQIESGDFVSLREYRSARRIINGSRRPAV